MKIPDNRNPYEVIINGVKKTYGAGETVADDAAVKQIIDDGELFPPAAIPAEPPIKVLPDVTVADDGKLLGVVSGKWGVVNGIPEIPVAENQADSTAETVAALVTDFNGLLAKLKDAGIMEADAAEG